MSEARVYDIDLAWDLYTKRQESKRSKRLQLEQKFKEQDSRCFYCERSTWLGFAYDMDKEIARMNWRGRAGKPFKSARATREHLVRVVDGGGDSDENIVVACAYCNHARGNRTVEEWKELRRPRNSG